MQLKKPFLALSSLIAFYLKHRYKIPDLKSCVRLSSSNFANIRFAANAAVQSAASGDWLDSVLFFALIEILYWNSVNKTYLPTYTRSGLMLCIPEIKNAYEMHISKEIYRLISIFCFVGAYSNTRHLLSFVRFWG